MTISIPVSPKKKAHRITSDTRICPICFTKAMFSWSYIETDATVYENDPLFKYARCLACHQYSMWLPNNTLIFPAPKGQFKPHRYMPEDVKVDFEEANSIVDKSPRGAAALLRLALQKLCVYLGGSGSINSDIKNLYKEGRDEKLRKAMDYVRVVGNEAVHPGEIQVNDNPEIARTLFKLINYIVDHKIALEREIDEVYESLPDDKKQQINDRDKGSK